MPRPDPREIATAETRSKGGQARAAKHRELRAEARQLAVERLAGMTDKALVRLEGLLLAESDADAYRAVKEVLDRVLGRPTQAVELTGEDGDAIQIEHRGVKLADVIDVARQAGMEPGD